MSTTDKLILLAFPNLPLETGCQPATIVHCGLNYARCVVAQATTVYAIWGRNSLMRYFEISWGVSVFSADCDQLHPVAMQFNGHIQTSCLQAHSPKEKGTTSVDSQIGSVCDYH